MYLTASEYQLRKRLKLGIEDDKYLFVCEVKEVAD